MSNFTIKTPDVYYGLFPELIEINTEYPTMDILQKVQFKILDFAQSMGYTSKIITSDSGDPNSMDIGNNVTLHLSGIYFDGVHHQRTFDNIEIKLFIYAHHLQKETVLDSIKISEDTMNMVISGDHECFEPYFKMMQEILAIINQNPSAQQTGV